MHQLQIDDLSYNNIIIVLDFWWSESMKQNKYNNEQYKVYTFSVSMSFYVIRFSKTCISLFNQSI